MGGMSKRWTYQRGVRCRISVKVCLSPPSLMVVGRCEQTGPCGGLGNDAEDGWICIVKTRDDEEKKEAKDAHEAVIKATKS